MSQLSSVLSLAGLCIDLLGVLLLGYDLVRIQNELRKSAAEKLIVVDEILANEDDFQKDLKHISAGADWRDGYYEEGQWISNEASFDYRTAQQSIADAMGAVAQLSDQFQTINRLILNDNAATARAAGISLKLSYVGLAMVVAGFALQGAGVALSLRPPL